MMQHLFHRLSRNLTYHTLYCGIFGPDSRVRLEVGWAERDMQSIGLVAANGRDGLLCELCPASLAFPYSKLHFNIFG
jgi:hypothetical protein